MSEQRLRELERRWKASGSLEAEVEYLRERLRCGALSQERLQLAALLASRGAGELADPAPADFEAWVAALEGFPGPLRARVGVAAARAAALEAFSLPLAFPPGLPARVREGVEQSQADLHASFEDTCRLLEAWIACPCAEHAAAGRDQRGRYLYLGGPHAAFDTLAALLDLLPHPRGSLLARFFPAPPPGSLRPVFIHATLWTLHRRLPNPAGLSLAQRTELETEHLPARRATLRESLSAALLPWALGMGPEGERAAPGNP